MSGPCKKKLKESFLKGRTEGSLKKLRKLDFFIKESMQMYPFGQGNMFSSHIDV